MKNTLLLCLFMSITINVFGQKEIESEAIKTMMLQQSSDWNEGNIDAFMQGYWQSDSLMFIGSRGITYGWKATLDSYKKGYPDRATGSLPSSSSRRRRVRPPNGRRQPSLDSSSG